MDDIELLLLDRAERDLTELLRRLKGKRLGGDELQQMKLVEKAAQCLEGARQL